MNTETYSNLNREESAFDRLTGLPAMNYFLELADEGFKTMIEKAVTPSVLAFNLNGLKMFNQKYGIEEGNRILVAFADILKKYFTPMNCSRFGEDHFYVFTDSANVELELYQIFDELRSYNNGQSLPVRVGIYKPEGFTDIVNVGLACDRARTACDIDRKTYESKYTYFTSQMEKAAKERDYIVNSIDKAIENGYIKTFYQPKIRTMTGNLCGAEALARWDDPEYGFLSPGSFIPILEDSNLTYKLDSCILEQLVQDMKTYKEAGYELVPVSINFSRTDFLMTDPLQLLENIVERSGIDRQYFRIEITESTVMDDPVRMKSYIDKFQNAGFVVIMDDFGSEYSSLAMLREFHFDALKIDMEFMKNFNERSRKILKAIVTMAKSLGMCIVAEGVDNDEQFNFLKSIGCEIIQGYYFAKPMKLQDLIDDISEKKLRPEDEIDREFYETIGKENLITDMATSLQYFDGNKFTILYSNAEYERLIAVQGLTVSNVMDKTTNTMEKETSRSYRRVVSAAMESGETETLLFSMGDFDYRLDIKLIAKCSKGYMFRIHLFEVSFDRTIQKSIRQTGDYSVQIKDNEASIWNSFVNNVKFKIYWKDEQGHFLGASKAFLEYYRFSSIKEIIGQSSKDLGITAYLSEEEDDEYWVLHGDIIYNSPATTLVKGISRNISETKIPIKKGNRIIGYIGYFIDVDAEPSIASGKKNILLTNDEEKHVIMDNALLSYDDIMKISQNMPIGIAVFRAVFNKSEGKVIDASYLYVNNYYCRAVQIERKELIGKTLSDFAIDMAEKWLGQATDALINDKEIFDSNYDEQIGHWVSYVIAKTPIPDCFIKVSIYSDIEHKEKEELKQIVSDDDFVMRIVKMLNMDVDYVQLMNHILREINHKIPCDRLYIFEYGNSDNQIYEWKKDGFPSVEYTFADDGSDAYISMTKLLDNETTINISDIEALKYRDNALYEVLKRDGIERFVEVPLYLSGKLLGYIGVDNYESETSVNVRKILESISFFIAIRMSNHLISQEKQDESVEKDIAKRNFAAEDVSIRLAKILNGTASYKQAMKHVLSEIGKTTHSERVYILEVKKQKVHFKMEWCADGVEPIFKDIPPFSVEIMKKAWEKMFVYDNCVATESIEIFKGDNDSLYNTLSKKGIYNLILAPFYHRGVLIGYLVTCNLHQDDSINAQLMLGTVSYFIGSKIVEHSSIVTAERTMSELQRTEVNLRQGEAELEKSNQIREEQVQIMHSLSTTFFTMHLFDLVKNTIIEYACDPLIKPYLDASSGVKNAVSSAMKNLVASEYLDSMMEFIDFSTLKDRMRNRNSITHESVGVHIGWFIATMTVIEQDDEGTPIKLLFTTQCVDEQKKTEQSLMTKAMTDELTTLYNRRAYEEDLKVYHTKQYEDNFIFISMDVNRLKYVNDNIGHAAGDELLKGASECMLKSFGLKGKIYRIGGDEFTAIIYADVLEMKVLEDRFNEYVKSWDGKLVHQLSISYGYVTIDDINGLSIEEVTKLADKRMYDDKARFYIESGLERRRR